MNKPMTIARANRNLIAAEIELHDAIRAYDAAVAAASETYAAFGQASHSHELRVNRAQYVCEVAQTAVQAARSALAAAIEVAA
jgi:hypothetical protein